MNVNKFRVLHSNSTFINNFFMFLGINCDQCLISSKSICKSLSFILAVWLFWNFNIANIPKMILVEFAIVSSLKL